MSEHLEAELQKTTDYDKISPTAWGVAYRRSLTDIPFAKDIFEQLQKRLEESGSGDMEIFKKLMFTEMTPQFEARYKLINNIIRQNPTNHILEIAAGLAPRGLEFTQDPMIEYIELDLPDMMDQKRAIVQSMQSKMNTIPNKNLYFEDGNALDLESLISASEHFTKGPITVTHEGLLRYLNFEEKEKVAKNIRALLEKFGGVWITPDITLRGILKIENDKHRDRINEMSTLVGRDIDQNVFEDIEHAQKFFGDLGFQIESHSFIEVSDELVSPERLNISMEQVKEMNSKPVVFVMRLK
jgi:O-methyltransferase involved in polyketide biosynthesis